MIKHRCRHNRNLRKLTEKIRLILVESDAVIIGARSGLSASAGYEFAVERLKKHFGDFVNKYKMTDMYTVKTAPL